jgi:hypothetical protein
VKERLGPKWLPLLIAIDGPDNIGTHSGGGAADARLNLKPLFDFLDMLDRSWLGAALKNYDHDPKSWNDVWPDSNKSVRPNSNKSSTPESSVQSARRSTSNPAELLRDT